MKEIQINYPNLKSFMDSFQYLIWVLSDLGIFIKFNS